MDVGPAPEPPESLGTVDNSIDPDCNDKFELCADGPATGRLVSWVSKAKRWMRDAETKCREKETEDEAKND